MPQVPDPLRQQSMPDEGIPALTFDPTETIETLRDERNLLGTRMINPTFSWCGKSSDAMVGHAMFGHMIPPHDFPADWGDYARCVNTYHRSPGHLRPAMLRCLRVFREHVAGIYPDGPDLDWMGDDPVA